MIKMKYDISKKAAPAMPRLGKGTECVRLLLSQVSKDMHEAMVPMLFPILGAQISESKFQYPDQTWKEMCGMMSNLVADSGCNKGQLSKPAAPPVAPGLQRLRGGSTNPFKKNIDKTFTPHQVRCVVEHLGEPLERGLAKAKKEKVPKCTQKSSKVPECSDRQNELS